jgi:low temperature requirement protein LtrA
MRSLFVRPITLRSGEGSAAGRKVTWLELFFDLGYVAAVAQVGAPLAEHYAATGLVRYALLLFLIWWAWLGHTLYSNRFDTDDVVQRLLTLAQIFGVAVMAINAGDDLASRDSAGFAAAYAGLRLLLVVEYLRARRVSRARTFAGRMAAGTAAAAVVWFASALTPAPARYALWAIALAADLATPLLTGRFTTHVPPDTAHLPERFGLFTIILLGESLVAVMRGMKTQEAWSLAAASSALLGMAMAFTLWWWYFDGVEAAGERHLHSRQDAFRLQAWTFAHLPLYLGIGVAGVGIEHVITFAPIGHLGQAEAWMLCGGLASAMAAVTAIAAVRPGRRGHRPDRAVGGHALLAAATLSAGTLAPLVHAAALLLALVALAVAQLLVSLRWMPPAAAHIEAAEAS